MKPDFIITEQDSPDGKVYIVLPTNVTALNWMSARVDAETRRGMSAQLDAKQMDQFRSDASAAGRVCAEVTEKHIAILAANLQ